MAPKNQRALMDCINNQLRLENKEIDELGEIVTLARDLSGGDGIDYFNKVLGNRKWSDVMRINENSSSYPDVVNMAYEFKGLLALRKALSDDETLDKEQSIENIINNTVEISNGEYMASGLIIAKDDEHIWLFAPYHLPRRDDVRGEKITIKEKSPFNRHVAIDRHYIITVNKNDYMCDDGFITSYEQFDIALMRIKISDNTIKDDITKIRDNDKAEVMKYRIAKKELRRDDGVVFPRKPPIPYRYGKVIRESYDVKFKNNSKVYDTVLTTITAPTNNSGRIITTPQGEIAGMIAYNENGYKGAVKIKNISMFINKCATDLIKKCLFDAYLERQLQKYGS